MTYRRRTSVGIAVALLSALVPMAAVALIAWQMAAQQARERLDTMAELLVKRAEQTIQQSADVMRQLAVVHLPLCSPQHIRLMRQFTVNAPALDEIAYVEQGQASCSSWGGEHYEPQEGEEVGRTEDGVEVSLSYMPAFSGGGPAVAMAYGNYRALIGLNHFVDVITEPGLQLGLATRSGTSVATIGASGDGALVQALSAGRAEPVPTPGYLQARVTAQDWVSVALAGRQGFAQYLRADYQELLFPLLAVGGSIFLLVIGIWLRRPTPLAELRAAIRRKELEVYYQPMFNQFTGECVGVEALLRWRQQDRNWIEPDLFIPIAEDGRLVQPMTDLLLSAVTEELAPMLKANPELHVSLNLYAEEVRTGRVLAELEHTLIAAGVRPRQIWLEVTERSFMDIESARITLKQAHDKGYVVAIDDFGTGYSSLQYLQKLPVDVLKVDKSFIVPIGTGAVSSHIIYHIIEMGKSLSLTIVAEGVETREQADYLAGLGVTLMQGWLYAPAMSADEIKEFVRRRQAGLE